MVPEGLFLSQAREHIKHGEDDGGRHDFLRTPTFLGKGELMRLRNSLRDAWISGLWIWLRISLAGFSIPGRPGTREINVSRYLDI